MPKVSPFTWLCVAGCLVVQEISRAADSADLEPVQKTLQRLVARNHGKGGGTVRISNANGVIWEGAAGKMAGPQSAGMTPDTPYEVASITKAVTAATIMRLIEDGKLTLDTTLAQVLPASEIRGFDGNITIRQLLSHTSGLPDYWTDGRRDREGNNAFLRAFLAEPGKSWTPQEILSYAREISAKRPGGRFHYSDTNYVLLGLIIERITGRPLHRVFRKMIFDPLKMNDTWLTYHEPQRGAEPSHRFEDEEDMHALPRQSADWAGGGLMSTNGDLEKFLRGLASGKLFKKPDTLETMRNEAVPVGEEGISYGLGLYRVQLDHGQGELWGHDGHGNSFAYYWPERDITFTGSLNQTGNDWWPVAQAFIEGEEPGVFLEEDGKSLDAALTAGWDSLYMYRGANSLRDSGTGYGSGIFWTDLDITWSITDHDFLTLDLWQCFATQNSSYKEIDVTLTYTRQIGRFELNFDYAFNYGYGIGNFYANELNVRGAYEFEAGPLTLIPSIGYYFNLGPDAGNGNGMAKAGSSFLLLRVDGHLPLYRDIIALEPWTAFGINFQYNFKTGWDGEWELFNGPNNIEFGISLPIRLHQRFFVAGFVAYSYALTSIVNTEPSTFWGGVSATVSF